MLHVALWEPEIPPNTGNVARLCAAVGARLHLIGRLGFRTDDKTLKRAGLDYWHAVDVVRHATWEEFSAWLKEDPTPRPPPPGGEGEKEGGCLSPPLPLGEGAGGWGLWAIDNPAPTVYTRAAFADGDVLLFGSESKGLPTHVRERFADRLLGIPMPTGNVRSLNLATAVGVVVYESLRQIEGW